MNASLDDMYREIILEHYRSPRGKKQVARVDISSDGINPSCGDEIALRVEMNQGNLADIHVDCKGCAISVASASMLVETGAVIHPTVDGGYALLGITRYDELLFRVGAGTRRLIAWVFAVSVCVVVCQLTLL